jgi:3-oxoacyl-[acyl-carrier-protein] synthase II
VTRQVLDLPAAAGVAVRPAAAAAAAVPAVLTGWSAVSPLGLGAEAFAAGIRSGRRAVAPIDRDAWQVPQQAAGLVPDFDQRAVLGPTGTRSMDRVTGLAVTCVGMLVAGAGPTAEMGLVLGTGTGSVQSMMDFTRDSLTQAKPFHVDPARFPNTVMNCAAGQCAIWHGLRGPNATVAGGRVTGLLALNYATRLQGAGHAETVLWGSVEEFSTQRSRLEWHARAAADRDRPLGEGCAAFVLEPAEQARRRGRPPLAEVLALDFGVHDAQHPPADVLTRCIRSVLRRAEVEPAQVWAVALSGPGADLAGPELAAVRAALAGSPPLTMRVDRVLGDTSAASAAFQLAALLAMAGPDRAVAGRCALVTAIDGDGATGCALIRNS